MAVNERGLSQTPSPFSRVLSELELTRTAIAALVLGWAAIWLAWAFVHQLHQTPAAVSATASWLSLVVATHAWRDLVLLHRRWHAGEYGRGRMHLPYRWWLAPLALLAGILLAHWLW